MSRGRRIGRIKNIPPTKEAAEKYLSIWSSGDLYNHIERFPKIDAETFFGKQGNINLEIGCGTGEFICNFAVESPENLFLGIDYSKRAIYHAVNLAEKNRLENIRFFKADIKLLYPLLVPNSLAKIYLHFPGPNYGAKNLKHRVFDAIFLDNIHTALIQGGIISVVSDQEPFFMDMMEIAEADERFSKNHKERYLEDFSPPVKSRFQRAWERVDRQIYRFELVKN
jgi:tRNA (guanine-N7-)-methyltransferase